jgi:mannose-6-phosphate isomerase-like protein (cupin superfamily)
MGRVVVISNLLGRTGRRASGGSAAFRGYLATGSGARRAAAGAGLSRWRDRRLIWRTDRWRSRAGSADFRRPRENRMIDPTEPLKTNLAERFAEFEDTWAPKIVARYNGNEVRLVRTEGEWVWHKHDDTDELFLILDGEFDMDFRTGTVTVGPGELLIVPRGVEHRPAARRGQVKLLLIDPDGTPNTGDVRTATPAVEL